MPMTIRCSCGRALSVDPAAAGKKVRCGACSAIVQVPAVAAPVAPPAVRGPGDDFADLDDPSPPRPKKPKPAPGKLPWLLLGGLGAAALVVGVVAAVMLLPGEKPQKAAARKAEPKPAAERKESERKEEPPPAADPVAGEPPAMAPDQIYRRLLRSSAWIVTDDGSGSGSLIDRDERLVLTNHHVVEGNKQVLVFFPSFNGKDLVTAPKDYLAHGRLRSVRGNVVVSDPRRDLALVQLDRLPNGVPAVALAADSPSPGARLVSIGASGLRGDGGGALWRLATGEVRQVFDHRFTYVSGQSVAARIIETQSPTNPGDSGGPVVNDRGRLVAVVAADDRRGQNVSVFIDVREVRAFLDGHFRKQDKARQETPPAPHLDAAQVAKLVARLDGPDRDRAIDRLGELGPEARPAVPALIKLTKGADAGLATKVLAALARVGPPDADDIGALLEPLTAGTAEVRLYALRSLAQLGTAAEGSLSGVFACAKHADREVRLLALQTLDALAGPENIVAVEAFVKALSDTEPGVRLAGLTGLANMGPAARGSAYEPVMLALGDEDAAVVRAAGEALAALGDPGPAEVPALRTHLKHKAEAVRLFAAGALKYLRGAARPAVEELVGALGDGSLRVRMAATAALAEVGPGARAALPALLTALADPVSPPPEAKAAASKTKVSQAVVDGCVWVISKADASLDHATGWVVDAREGLVVTSCRAVKDRPAAFVFFPHHEGGKLLTNVKDYLEGAGGGSPARVVFADPQRDLALVRVGWIPQRAVALKLAPRPAAPGEGVHAVAAVDVNTERAAGSLWKPAGGAVRHVRPAPAPFEGAPAKGTVACVITTGDMPQAGPGGPVVNDNLELVGQLLAGGQPGVCLDVSEVRRFLERASRAARLGVVGQTAAPPLTRAGFRVQVLGAVEKVGADDGERLVPALRTALRDEDVAVRARALQAARGLWAKAGPLLPDLLALDQPAWDRADAEYVLARVGKPLLPELEKLLDGADRQRLVRGVGVLREMGPAAAPALPALRRWLAKHAADAGLAAAIRDAMAAIEKKGQ